MKTLFDKLEIDLSLLKLTGVNLNELLTLIKIYSNTIHKQSFEYRISELDISSLLSKRMIRETSHGYVLREVSYKIIERAINVTIEEKKTVIASTDDYIDRLVARIRNRFKGLKIGAMGDAEALKQKLIRWRISNPEVTDDEIMQAVDKYIESQDNLKYLQRADYFIYKKMGGVEHSRLSTFVEEIRTPKENSDWGNELK